MLNTCPVCAEQVETPTLSLYQKHVSAHFDDPDHSDEVISDINNDQENSESAGQYNGEVSTDETVVCPVCVCPIGDLQVDERSAHVASHFDEEDYESSPEMTSSAFRKPDFTQPKAKRDRRDVSWSSVHSPIDSLPPNYSPNLIPILYQILNNSAQTRSAVLCFPHGTTHIRSRRGWDSTWGCGFRNFQMCFSALAHPLAPGGGVDDGEGVSVWTLQSWIEDAWNEGFDEVGRSQFKGKMRGIRKWIGAADIWVGLMCAGIQCQLYDFPKATSTGHQAPHAVLQRWVVNYFNSDDTSPETRKRESTLSTMMSSQGQSIRISAKLPLILQHQGHSRTIVGYETLASGDTNLLLFDPAKTVPDHLRKLAIEGLKADRENIPTSSRSQSTGEQMTSDPPPVGDVDDIITYESEPQSPIHIDDGEETDVTVVHTDVSGGKGIYRDRTTTSSTMSQRKQTESVLAGKKRRARESIGIGREKRWRKDVGSSLNCFRVNLRTLKRNSEYQILAFSGGPILPQTEREKHKVVVSTKVSK